MTESTTPAPLFELAWRELLFQHTEGLAAAFERGTVTGYCGFDPTASSLHVGISSRSWDWYTCNVPDIDPSRWWVVAPA
jgi:hypothetical protein